MQFEQMEQLHFNFQSIDSEALNLTEKEKEVLTLICNGDSNNEIGQKLQLSSKTIEAYKTRLLSKTKTRNSAHLVLFAVVNKIVEV